MRHPFSRIGVSPGVSQSRCGYASNGVRYLAAILRGAALYRLEPLTLAHASAVVTMPWLAAMTCISWRRDPHWPGS